jgi:hypothetical protein
MERLLEIPTLESPDNVCPVLNRPKTERLLPANRKLLKDNEEPIAKKEQIVARSPMLLLDLRLKLEPTIT